MKKIFEEFTECPVRSVLDRFGDKWSLLVLLTLAGTSPLRFGEISKLIPDVSQKMLTTTLKTLQADGLLLRKSYPVIPPKVEYHMTPLGYTLIPHIHNLLEWAQQNGNTIRKARRAATDV